MEQNAPSHEHHHGAVVCVASRTSRFRSERHVPVQRESESRNRLQASKEAPFSSSVRNSVANENIVQPHRQRAFSCDMRCHQHLDWQLPAKHSIVQSFFSHVRDVHEDSCSSIFMRRSMCVLDGRDGFSADFRVVAHRTLCSGGANTAEAKFARF